MQERPWKILVADDNQQNLELLEAYLADVHCQVVAAVDGEDARAKIESEKPDLILLDVMMPKVSGFEICRQVKSNPATREIPVLMITSLHETADIERGVDAGADDFLSKPVHKQILLTRVRSLLKVRSLKSELERTLAYLQEVEAPRPDV